MLRDRHSTPYLQPGCYKFFTDLSFETSRLTHKLEVRSGVKVVLPQWTREAEKSVILSLQVPCAARSAWVVSRQSLVWTLCVVWHIFFMVFLTCINISIPHYSVLTFTMVFWCCFNVHVSKRFFNNLWNVSISINLFSVQNHSAKSGVQCNWGVFFISLVKRGL